jgi:uncharacterized protein (TIGR03437 family)
LIANCKKNNYLLRLLRLAPCAAALLCASPVSAQLFCPAPGPPRIGSLRNGASFRDFGFAINTAASILGCRFQEPGGITYLSAEDIADGRLPYELGGVSVEVAGRLAPMLYVDFVQINFQIPSVTLLGDVSVVVILNPGAPNEMRSEPATMRLDPYAPALFRYGISECVAARFQDGGPAADPDLIQDPSARPPRAGETITIYLTGLGVTDPFWQAGEIVSSAAEVLNQEDVRVELNGTIVSPADILYVGLSPGSVSGLYQINLRVPDHVRRGDNNRIKIYQGGFSSQDGITLPVGPD